MLSQNANHCFHESNTDCMGATLIEASHRWCLECGHCNTSGCISCKRHTEHSNESVNPIASSSTISSSSELVRSFETGATRSGGNKPDYSGYLSPTAIQRYGEYMLKHQVQEDGTIRSSSNWKLGIPLDSFKESLVRHTIDLWAACEARDLKEVEELACAVLFNAQGLLHELLKKRAKEDLPF